MFIEPEVESSYKKTPGFGLFFYDYVLEHKPKRIIEFGTRWGYSALCMAQALRDLGEGHIWTYDQWEQVPLNNIIRTIASIESYGLQKWITVEALDFYEWVKDPTPFDLLHIDINNTGETLQLLQSVFPKQHVIFEGGILERDRVHWMKDFIPMTESGVKYKILLSTFPGVSRL